MLTHQIIEKVLPEIRLHSTNNRLLQIGPGNETTEINLNAVPDWVNGSLQEIGNKAYYDCNRCPFTFTCKKGAQIQGGHLKCKAKAFNDIILLANSGLGNSRNIKKSLSVLRANGNLVLLACKKQKCKQNNAFMFNVDELLPQIKENNLEIQSITNMKIDNQPVMCMVVSKS